MSDDIVVLKSISLKYFNPGMVLSADLYDYTGSTLLVSKDSGELTERDLERIEKFNLGRQNVRISAESFAEITSKYDIGALLQEEIEQKVGVTMSVKKTKTMIENVKNTDKISKDETENIALEVAQRIDAIDPALVFQCIGTGDDLDEYLFRHSVNVATLNALMGKWLNYSSEDIKTLALAGLVHDIGKIKIPTEILDAPRKLTDEEFAIIQMHPVHSDEILRKSGIFPDEVLLAARHHHEKTNGTGYPDKLTYDEISPFAAITAVSDVYDAMVSKRSYKEARCPFDILHDLANQKFSHLNNTYVEVFTNRLPYEFVGKEVMMSSGVVGIVRYIFEKDLKRPVVEIDGELVKTSDDLYCVRMMMED